MERVPGGVYSGAFWGNGCNYRIIASAATYNSGAAVYGFNIWREKGGNENRRLHIERRRGVEPMREVTTGGGIIPARCVASSTGGSWGVFPARGYSGAFWGNRCNFRIAVIMAMFGTLDRL